MTMDGLNKRIPDLKYRVFMLKLSHQITAQDLAEIKYVLTSLIPDGKMESLDSAIELFRYLERILFVEPNNLGDLEQLCRIMDKPELCEMITKFIHDRKNGTVESCQIPHEDVQKIGTFDSDPA